MFVKKAVLYLTAALLILCLFSCQREKKDISLLFDNVPPQNTEENPVTDNTGTESEKTQPSGNTSESGKNPTETVQQDKVTQETTPEEIKQNPEEAEETNGETTENSEDKKEETPVQSTPVLDETELQTIKSRYIEAEDFYYTMLYQQYDLDSYDVIEKTNSDGYSSEYHRVLYYNVNSLDELKNCYGEYFTQSFISGLDFNSYVEENGKLYCAETDNSHINTGVKHIYSVEVIDQNNVFIVRTNSDGSSLQKIKAVKSGGIWYFGGVAIGE